MAAGRYVDCRSRYLGLYTNRPHAGSSIALATARAAWPVTTTISPTPAAWSASTACCAIGLSSTSASCFVSPNLDPVPAARPTPEITSAPAPPLQPQQTPGEVP